MNNNLKPWHIDVSDYRAESSIEEKIKFFLRFAILAPSAHNNQPWRVVIENNRVDIYLDLQFTPRTGTLRQTAYSIGAFIENFVQSAQHFGYMVTVQEIVLNHRREDRIASLILNPLTDGDKNSVDLFEGIVKRHTNRGMYDPAPLPQDFLEEIQSILPSGSAHLTIVSEPETKAKLSQLISKSVRIALTLAPLRRELSDFVHYLKEEEDTGMLVECMVQNPPDGDSGKEWTLHQMDPVYDSEFSRVRFLEAPSIFLLSSKEEGSRAWINVGRTLQRVLLVGAKRGYTQDISAAAVEIPVFFPMVKKVASLPGRVQIIFRLGMPKDPSFTIPTPRRSVDSILSEKKK
jgi:hypothetical protein